LKAISGGVAATDPKGESNAVSYTTSLSCGSVTLVGGSLILWATSAPTITIGGTAVSITAGGTVGSWTLYYATGITLSGALVFSGSSTIFNLVVVSARALSAGLLAYWFADVNRSRFDTVPSV
jgi:hypothetical protein